MRRSILLIGVLLGLMAVAPPAAAKCELGAPRCPTIKSARAVIRGPGLDQPIVLRGGAVWELARRTGIDSYRSTYVEYASDNEFPGVEALGARFRVRYVLRLVGRDPLTVRQDLYPYAVNTGVGSLKAAWAFTPKGQRFVTHYGQKVFGDIYPVEGGWWKSSALLQSLLSEGLPEIPPAAQGATAKAQAGGVAAEESAGGRPGGPFATVGWFLLLAVGAMLMIGALKRAAFTSH